MQSTKDKILDLAERLTQTHGFSGFSYLDLADKIGIKNSSIHYHFKAKADLAEALVDRVRSNHKDAYDRFDHEIADPKDRLWGVIEFFEKYVKEKKFCLCGMMAAEFQSINAATRRKLKAYFATFTTWVAKQFREMGAASPDIKATQFVSALEGALLLARLANDPAILREATGTILET